MTLNDLIKTIHVSINDANKMHMKWTGGWWVTAYGVESFIVGNIARGIMDLPNPPKYATMETKFSELYDNSGIRPKGPSRVASKSNNRLDLALYVGENLSHAIELKRFWDPKCLEDLDRLAELYRTLNKEKGGSLRAGIFVLLAACKARRGRDARNNLAQVFERYEEKCANHLKLKWLARGINSYEFSRGVEHVKPTLLPDGQAFSSLCVVIK